MKIEEIEMGHRIRKDLGDIEELASSIKEVGLLHPIVVTTDGVLVAGARRIAAYRVLGRKEIPATAINVPSLLAAERDENEVRKDFTPSEAVAIGRLVEKEEQPKARERLREGQRRGPRVRDGDLSVNVSERSGQQNETAAIAGRAVGMSRPTYMRAKSVIEAAEADPERFGDLVQQMDETGKVRGAWEELRKRTNGSPPKSGKHPSRMRLRKMAAPSNGLQFARMAIRDLEQIRPDDTERARAFDLVEGWIDEHK